MNLILLLLFFGLQDSTGEPPTHTPPESENPSRNDNQHLTWAHMDSVYMLQPCNKSREVIQNSWGGTISDGPLNYTQDTHCEWLIKAPPGYWISLKVDQIRTECSYDFLFVIDGMSYVQGQSKLLASFSGASNPHVNILAQSGYMLILLYSDPNYALEGFLAEYSISPCPLNCSNVGECVQIQTQNVCKCGPQRSGVGCEKIKSNNETFSSLSLLEITESYDSSSDDEYEDTQVLLASSWNSVLARVGHSMIQLNANHTYIFGGFDLNTLLDNLIILDLYNGTIQKVAEKQDEQTEKESERVVISPSGRFAHAAVRFKTGFFIHGGKTEVGVSNDLFYYNATNGRWSQLIPQANQSTIPKLMYHSMTLTPSGHIYVFGGAKSSGKFSSTLYQFHGDSPTNWTIVKSSCCGKETHRSYLGHTMSYWPQKNSLILFGGIGTSDYGRFSKLSSQLWIFMLNSTTWLHLDYKKNGGVPPGIYLERAFHTAHIVEQYLIIFGGYTHVHNKDETCYSNQMLVYNLECQIFLPITPPSASSSVSSSSEYRATRGLFGHQSVIVDDYLLIVGGYRGYLSQSVRKIPFPFTKSKSSRCSSFDRWRCSGEPQCGWCPTNGRCFDKLTGAANCTTNLQTAQCPGICPLLTSCQSCTSAFPGCVWCGTLEQCWKQTLEEVGSRTNVCNNPLDKSSQTSVVQCAEKSWRMGLTQFEHRFPPNFSNPDAVKVINSSVLIISREYGSTIPVDTPVTFALRGSLLGISHPIKKLELCALQAAVNLTLYSDEIFNSSYRWTDYQLCYNLTWPSSGNSVYLLPGQTIKFDLVASSFGKGVNQEKSGRVTIQLKYYSGPISSPRVLRKDHLIPFDGDSAKTDVHHHHHRHHHCLSYRSCLSCAGDTSCVWRLDTRLCIPRTIPIPSSNLNPLSGGEQALMYNPALPLIAHKSSLIIQPENCPGCSDMNFCEDCLDNNLGLECEWWDEEMSCQRLGRLENAIRQKDKCPESCSRRKTCSSCVDTVGKCVWCETRQECFIFSVYTSVYQFGQCFQWIDKADVCKRCDKQPTCESCVLNIGCGWSYDENGGSCSEGDFGGPYKNSSSSAVLNLISNVESSSRTLELLQDDHGRNKTWTYGECPDVNECELGIDDCHPNATCVNTPGSHACFCQPGFTGDGRTECEQTCREPCLHGTCSTEFVCECELGWTGSDCSEDCLCNNHSFCYSNGPGKCDKCQDFTTGENCELCAEGSYGNATLSNVGCIPCNCNGHGDVEVGLCDPIAGHCFCLNNTTGKDCSECGSGFYGDPTDAKPCYHSCSGRVLIVGRQGFFGSPPDLGSSFLSSRKRQQMMQQRNTSFVHVEHCLWIIKGEDFLKPSSLPLASGEEDDIDDETQQVLQPRMAGLLITIEPGLDIPCSHNTLAIHKGYSDFGVNGKAVPLVAAICSEKEDRDRRTTSNPTIIPVEGTVATIVLKYARMGSTKFSFNGSFKVLTEDQMEHLAFGTSPFSRNSATSGGPFNVSSLYDGTSPSLSVLSRYGHSLHVDQNNLWVFGGYSLSHGALDDIRGFSRKSNSWVPLTITVQQNEEAVPPARYFHGGVIDPHLMIFIHGGISANLTFLSDTWKFDTMHSRWSKFCEGPSESPKLAGHTLTLRPVPAAGPSEAMGGDSFTIVMIGGFNPEDGFSDKVYGIGPRECWSEVETTGSNPLGVYGHTTVYHRKTDAFYVFGGTLHHDTIGMQHGSISTSSKLYCLHWQSKKWSVLAPMEENQFGPYPTPRFLHSAVSTDDYMVVLGGIGSFNKEKTHTALVYVYQCNLWLLVGSEETTLNSIPESSSDTEETLFFTPKTPDTSRYASGTTVWKNDIFQMGGWKDGTTSESLFQITTPTDPCSLQKTKSRCKATLGCAFCSSNNNRSQQCYDAELDMPSACSFGASNIEFWKGITCTSTWMIQQGCGRFNSCTECLATWPSHPNISQSCQWCTNGKEGRCIPLRKKFEEDSPCGQKQWVITDSSQCPERLCSAPQCEKCTANTSGKCIWTRHVLRARERGWEFRLQPVYDWNCVRHVSSLDTSPNVPVVSSPPASCPIPCWHFDSCQECLESLGSEGGFHQCYWSVSQHRCISPAYSPLLCFGGICGPILKGSPSICPKACTTLRSCNSCLENPSCGWCAIEGENGEGVCLSTNAVSESSQCSNHSKWHYLKCAPENECTNGHHGCDSKSEQCIDLEEGYRCQCKSGFERSDTSCIPICSDGCVHGHCIEPQICECNFGYVGSNCSAQCDCHGHSNCAGVEELDVCLECKNNTMGPKCSQCKPMFVGDPRNNGACIACSDYCNGHSGICLSHGDYNKWCNGTNNKYLSSSQLMSKILSSGLQIGPSTTAFCCHCENQTSGDTCNDCISGFFRGYDDKRLPCRKCECHGHGDTCDQVTGHDCNCDNNTESDSTASCHNTLKQNLHHQCWTRQCSKCRESYLGTPTNGHQCYMQMQMEEFYCFDPKSHDQSCAMKQKHALLSGRTVFFAVQPKFMNVNIRITLDVTHGSINVYLSPKDDTFVIKQENWVHRVDFDTKYGLTGDRKDSIFGKSTSFSMDNHNNKVDIDYEISNKTDDVEDSGVNRIIHKPSGVNSNSAYRFVEQEAAGYATYYTVQDPKAVLRVRNLRNRLVVTLPQESHDLRLTRFYLVLEGIGDVSFGSIVFRQDQLHIDLFIFFSVFFAAFFLFLASCGIAWKVKQNMESRRARNLHLTEMLTMAKRPFAVSTVLLQPDPSSGIAAAYTQCRKSCRKGCICLRPLSVEWLAGTNNSNAVCTMLIGMPGGNNAPVRMCIGSVLANLQRSNPPYHSRRRRLQH